MMLLIPFALSLITDMQLYLSNHPSHDTISCIFQGHDNANAVIHKIEKRDNENKQRGKSKMKQ